MVDRWHEYRYRSLFHVTHDEFLAEPAETVEWMVAMADVEAKVRNNLAARSRG